MFCLMIFFWKMVVNVYDGVCRNVGFVVNDVDKTQIFGVNYIRNLVLENWLDREE